MNQTKLFFIAIAVAFLSACGGGGGSPGTSGSGGGSGGSVTSTAVVTPASIELLISGNEIPSAAGNLNITAIVKNAGNVGLVGQTVTFSATSGVIAIVSAVTNENGVASATISAGANKSNRAVTVTALAAPVSVNLVLPVGGTKIQITGLGTMQAGGASAYTAKLTDSSGQGIAGQSITVTSSLGNSLVGTGTTDGNGVATFLYTANNAGNDTIAASSLGATSNAAVAISNVDLSAVSPAANDLVPVNTAQIVKVRYRIGGVGQAGRTVTFSTTRGALSAGSAVTDSDGEASISVSSSSAGLASVVGQISGVGQVVLPLQFVALTPASLLLQANPGALSPNASGSANQSSLEAIVRDASGNAVANRQVNFRLITDASNGRLAQASATTDINGRASVQFISGADSTASEGVVVQAEVASTSVSGTTALTVNGQALFIALAFGNTIANQDETTYKKQFSVYVTDANGAAVGNKQVTIRVLPTVYAKGTLTFIDPAWTYFSYTQCPNEDVNQNGVLNALEDTNLNGQIEPGNKVTASPALVTTGADGFATFFLLYGEQYPYWLEVNLEARATVGGTESKTSLKYALQPLAADVTNATIPPAAQRSPFGVRQSCTDPN